MAFLRNNTINLLNLHYGMHTLAMAGGGVFFSSYLLHAGVPAAGVLCAIALITGLRFIIRPSILALGKRWGLKPLVVLGSTVNAFQYIPLSYVHGVDGALLATCMIGAIGDTFYWTAYHAYFAALGDEEHRGHQISAREALSAGVGIVAPLIGGWSLTAFGPHVTFFSVAAIQMFAALPFLFTPNVAVPALAPGTMKAALQSVAMFAADGWIQATGGFTWEILLFVTLGQSFTAFGGAVALAAVVGALAGLVLGRLIDLGHGRRAVWLAIGAAAAMIAMRAASAGLPALAVAANALGALTGRLYTPTMMTAVYNQAKGSPCVLRFHIATEGGWDIGCTTGCLIAAGLISLGVPLSGAILLTLLGLGASFTLMRQYYARHPGVLAAA
jgi:hypothetical protein